MASYAHFHTYNVLCCLIEVGSIEVSVVEIENTSVE